MAHHQSHQVLERPEGLATPADQNPQVFAGDIEHCWRGLSFLGQFIPQFGLNRSLDPHQPQQVCQDVTPNLAASRLSKIRLWLFPWRGLRDGFFF
jgi:hypothetical protein